jgi:hypothetical protein
MKSSVFWEIKPVKMGWRLRGHFRPKRPLTCDELHDVPSRKVESLKIWIFSVMPIPYLYSLENHHSTKRYLIKVTKGCSLLGDALFFTDVHSVSLRCVHRFFLFIASGVGLSPLYYGHFWPIVPAPDDRWGWLWSNWWNENWQGKPKYSEKTCPSATLSATNPTLPYPGSNPGRRGGKPATNRLSYGAAAFIG